MSEGDSNGVTVLESATDRCVARTGLFEVIVAPDHGPVRVSRTTGNDDHLTLSPGGPTTELLTERTVSSVRTETTNSGDVRIHATGVVDSNEYTTTIRLPAAHPGTLSYDVAVEPSTIGTLTMNEWGPELSVHDGSGARVETAFTSYLDGTPGSNPAAGTSDLNQFVYAAVDPLDATLLYLANWPALDTYFRRTGTNMRGTVATPPGDVGFVPPEPEISQSDGGDRTERLISVLAATVVVSPDSLPVDEPHSYCGRFVEDVAAIYDNLNRPDPETVDWRSISRETLAAVRDPANRFEYEGTVHPGGVELVTAMSIVTPFRAYAERFADDAAARLTENVADIVEAYYDPDYEDVDGNTGMIANSPAPVTLTHVDAWYLFWPVIQSAEYALAFDDDAIAEMVVDTADVMVDVGRALDYEFPMWIDVDGLRGYEPTDHQWDGYQYDCTGAYAYLMCQYHDLTGEQRYLDEAEVAADRLLGYGFELPYEFTTTPLTLRAMGQLAERTGEDQYLDASYIGLANILRHAYFFDPEYGSFEGRRVFLLNEAMPPEGYEGNFFANALEEWSLLRYLDQFLRESGDDLSRAARRLTAELLRHKRTSLADSLVRFQPDTSLVFDGIAPQSGRRVNHGWALPLEPFGALEPMFDRLGEIGQDLYGAGAYPEAACQQSYPLTDGVTLLVDGPVAVTCTGEYTWEVRVLGAVETYGAVLHGDSDALVDYSVRRVEEGSDSRLGEEVAAEYDPTAVANDEGYRLSLNAGETYAVRKTVPKRAVIVKDFGLDASRIEPGESTTVSLTVVNTTSIEGTYEVSLSIASSTRTTSVDLSAHGSVDVSFVVAPADVGTYNLQIAHENRALHVGPE